MRPGPQRDGALKVLRGFLVLPVGSGGITQSFQNGTVIRLFPGDALRKFPRLKNFSHLDIAPNDVIPTYGGRGVLRSQVQRTGSDEARQQNESRYLPSSNILEMPHHLVDPDPGTQRQQRRRVEA